MLGKWDGDDLGLALMIAGPNFDYRDAFVFLFLVRVKCSSTGNCAYFNLAKFQPNICCIQSPHLSIGISDLHLPEGCECKRSSRYKLTKNIIYAW